MKPNTHLRIDAGLVGTPGTLTDGAATVTLDTDDRMRADSQGLVHGGFVFGAADYAAMLAVNDPLVVLGSAETRFLAPVRVGERVVVRARVEETKGKKRRVEVDGHVDDTAVFRGTFTCFVLERHVLENDS